MDLRCFTNEDLAALKKELKEEILYEARQAGVTKMSGAFQWERAKSKIFESFGNHPSGNLTNAFSVILRTLFLGDDKYNSLRDIKYEDWDDAVMAVTEIVDVMAKYKKKELWH